MSVIICARCGNIAETAKMSMFNTDMLCLPCKEKEKTFLEYAEAKEKEHQAVKAGNFNFPGIGLPQKYIDEYTEDLWDKFSDIPMDPETEEIEEPFLYFKKGTHREDIWHWFDEKHSKGVYFLLYERG